jgi:hypothetical protein
MSDYLAVVMEAAQPQALARLPEAEAIRALGVLQADPASSATHVAELQRVRQKLDAERSSQVRRDARRAEAVERHRQEMAARQMLRGRLNAERTAALVAEVRARREHEAEQREEAAEEARAAAALAREEQLARMRPAVGADRADTSFLNGSNFFHVESEARAVSHLLPPTRDPFERYNAEAARQRSDAERRGANRNALQVALDAAADAGVDVGATSGGATHTPNAPTMAELLQAGLGASAITPHRNAWGARETAQRSMMQTLGAHEHEERAALERDEKYRATERLRMLQTLRHLEAADAAARAGGAATGDAAACGPSPLASALRSQTPTLPPLPGKQPRAQHPIDAFHEAVRADCMERASQWRALVDRTRETREAIGSSALNISLARTAV